ncbi:hypothetical protein [Nocardioides alcanivorans]|uniref:hypothetical protein n=1 Tax=Nocardioides alcanivorans TaxID=2897352 RepID=UPI001F4085C9|nr:hypothetical protein [Nocardioides alcanivorans]
MKLDNPLSVTFEVDRETRTIRGLALPFGDVAVSKGRKWTFAKGTLTWSRVKGVTHHDLHNALATVAFEETDEGLWATAKVAKTTAGDELLALCTPDPDTGEAVWDGLSVGIAEDGLRYVARGDVHHVTAGVVNEVTFTPVPAFERARITSVAASAAQEGTPMKCTKCGNVHLDGVTECATAPAFSAESGNALAKAVDDLTKKVDGLADIKIPVGGGAQFQVTEEPLYRFDGSKASSGHDFSADLLGAIKGDQQAGERVLGFMSESLINPKGLQFVATGDVESVNQPVYRPDMFKDEEPAQPAIMYDTFYAGGLSSVTPFFYSQLKGYGGLIGDHTQGVPPTAGTFETEDGATITPGSVSGRIFLTREAADQGGNPQISGLIWSKFQRTFREMLERRTAKVLHDNLANITRLATIAAGAEGRVVGEALKGGLVDLAFTPDGSRFSRFFGAKALYRALSHAVDGNDRPLYPILSPSNADGTSSSRLGSINVAGINVAPTWSTEIPYGAEGSELPDDTSFYADPMAVKIWNSGLTRLDKVGETAAGWNIDVFAYVATHLYDLRGLRRVEYKAV